MPRSMYLRTKDLDRVFGAIAYTSPATLYFALVVGDPSGAGVEVSGGSYARVGVTNNSTNFPAASGSPPTKSNASAIVWTDPTGSWGTPTYWAIYDASTSGNLLRYGTITNPVAIATGSRVEIPAGELDLLG